MPGTAPHGPELRPAATAPGAVGSAPRPSAAGPAADGPAPVFPGANPEPGLACWRLPPEVTQVDFLSDLHLSADTPATLAALIAELRASPAQLVVLLGDLLEAWPGDDAWTAPATDAPGAVEVPLLQALRARAARTLSDGQPGLAVMRGNRDFLLGAAFEAATGARLLADPCLLQFASGTRALLSHGDALCTDDAAYQQFRAQVRTPGWQQAFLAQPLADRRAFARSARAASQARHAERQADRHFDRQTVEAHDPGDSDPDPERCAAWLDQVPGTPLLIHGHTHRPAQHALPATRDGQPRRREVLSDWDAEARPPRGEVLRLEADGRVTRRAPLGGPAG